MDIESKLKDQGWYLTEDGIKKIRNACGNEGSKNNVQTLIQIAKDMDFRDIAAGALARKRDDDSIAGKMVLQLQKIRVVSAPKANEESRAAPRLMQIEFSDGQATINALEMEYISAFNLDIPPGTKVYFRNEILKLAQGNIEMRPKDIQILGGHVEPLVEKWKMARTMQQYTKMGRPVTGDAGPPPWIAFGQKIEASKDILQSDRNFKSLQAASDRDKDSKENEEFNNMRQEAIANANKASSKKIFGGGAQVLLDHNIKKILEKGYSEEEAKEALRATNNNLEKAFYSLKRGSTSSKAFGKDFNASKAPQTSRSANTRSENSGGKRSNSSAKDDLIPSKPATTNVSLFDFLTDKFPTTTESSANSTTKNQSSAPAPTYSSSNTEYRKQENSTRSDSFRQNHRSNSFNDKTGSSKRTSDANENERPRFENNLSSSFAANRNPSHPVEQERKDFRNSQNYNSNTNYNSNNSRETNYTPSNSNRRGGGGGNMGSRGEGGNNRNSSDRTFKGPPPPNEERKFPAREFRNSNRQLPPNTSQNNTNSRNSRHQNDNRNYNGDESSTDRGSNFKKSYSGRNQNSNYPQQTQGSEERYNPSNSNNNRYNQNSQRKSSNPPSNQQVNQGNATNSSTSNYQSNKSNSKHEVNMNQLIDSTAKMTIEPSNHRNANQQQQQHLPQQHQQQHQQAPNKQNQHRNQNRQQPPVMVHGNNQTQSSNQYSNNQKQTQKSSTPAAAGSYTAPQYLPSPPPPAIQQPQIANVRTNMQTTFSRPVQNGLTYEGSEPIPVNIIKGQAISMLPHQVVTSVVTSQPPQPTQVYLATTSHSPGPVFAAGPSPPAAYIIPSPPLPPAPQLAATAATIQPQPYGIIQPTDVYPWKVGDRCLAKYWDDGRFYDAEITGVSESTCVVYYLGYGNHEEVLKTDLLPVTDFIPQTHAVKSFTTTNLQPAPAATLPPPPQQPITFQATHVAAAPPPACPVQVAPLATPIAITTDDRNPNMPGKKRFSKNITYQRTYIPPNQRNKNSRPNYS